MTDYHRCVTDSNKEQLRFNKNKMLIGHPEEVSLRPSANSMMFKQTNINPNLPLNSGKCLTLAKCLSITITNS